MSKTESKSRDVVIKHGVFWYHEPTTVVVDGKEEERLVEKLAFHGQAVTLTRASDIERGEQHGAFFADEELAKRPGALPAAPEDEDNEVAIDELDDEELVDWLMSTGEFDGNRKPNADEVVSAAEGDADLARRLLAAEQTATGNSPRKTVESGLNEIIESESE